MKNVTIRKMKHEMLIEEKGKKSYRIPLWALIDEWGHTIIQVYSMKEPTHIKEELEKD